MRILLLGGTTEASAMARAVVDEGVDGVFSYAGRTEAPVAQPLPTRVGGFGGIAGLCDYLRAENITHVIDATHPFAAQMSGNAVAACAAAGVHLMALERAPWRAVAGDVWTHVPDLAAAAQALDGAAQRVFLAIGRQHLEVFAGQPQHHYLLRLVDAPQGALPLPQTQVVIARGPFDLAGDLALMRDHGTQVLVAKNAGGKGAAAKLAAARALGIAVIMVERPAIALPAGGARAVVADQGAVLDWLHQTARSGV